MNVKELCKEMLKEKMVSPNTVMLNLQKFKDMFKRVEKGVYELVKKKQSNFQYTEKPTFHTVGFSLEFF